MEIPDFAHAAYPFAFELHVDRWHHRRHAIIPRSLARRALRTVRRAQRHAFGAPFFLGNTSATLVDLRFAFQRVLGGIVLPVAILRHGVAACLAGPCRRLDALTLGSAVF